MEVASNDEFLSPPAWVSDHIQNQVIVVPAEHVALHLIDLPIRSVRQKRAALRFALEEAVGNALDTLHFAICETRKDGKLLAAVIARDVMETAVAVRANKPVVAEQFLLAAPSSAREWRTHRHGDRVLVRTVDGTGFAAQIDALDTIWRLSGKPSILNSGASLPDRFSATSAISEHWPTASDVASHDLRQGHYRPALGLERPLKWLAASVVLAFVGHLGLAMADARAQSALADGLRGEAASVLQARLPAASVEDDPASVLRQITATATPTSGSGFLPLMNDVSTAWVRDGVAIDVRQLNWSSEGLRLVIEAPDLEALQGAEASLTRAGLTVSSGSATADAGSARAEFLVRR